MTRKLMSLCFSMIAIGGLAQSHDRLEKFSKIVAQGGGNVEISHSDTYTLRVDVRNGCGERVNTSVSSETLYLQIENVDGNDCTLTIHVGVPLVDELVLNGGGNIILNNGFDPRERFECKIRGGGNVDVSQLQVDSFLASVEGGGIMQLTAQKFLRGDISGGGIIEYSGTPKVERHVFGGGIVRSK